ncbi:MAG: type III-B CRISPR module RAMP protein Cmr4 [Pyrobaculum arsenaticum]|uniref:CRISPR-associated protein, Cmr4 family n=1 Tax=Pyrobaculum arsenaticum (strain DSM 13514 / JCM 11321 / PZ6) TaxID=340102 RepID=A4WJX8_PYRAR|nr:type III-B CRISPR module RAMP protein Cmr4 [Pyrobaculum arsenaticum]ABP50695.1 CRISPR-associated protein, Cmr4 family [Pyrobaculum arsenaticum DSM 13514]MCY0891131.1 type III-B CRISPR module RAMP protein Cmr4 [Pyrobaculum arsenaticum]
MPGRLFWVLALTSIHPGVGRSEAAHVDLPVQRDEFGLPAIWATSLKGAVRAKAEGGLFAGPYCVDVGKKDECAKVIAAFGPKPEYASEHSSAVAFLDAKLFAVPARSLRGVWIYVTSPLLLGFAKLYSQALGVPLSLPQLPTVGEGEVALSSGRFAENNVAVINEMKFKVVGEQAPALNLPPFDKVKQITGSEPGFAVVSDQDLPRVVRRSLLVQYRVRLKKETKTVETGPWSEEYIPPFTVFITGIHCNGRVREAVRVRLPPKDDKKNEEVVELKNFDPCAYVESKAKGPLWIGGKETVGKGLVEIL